MKRSRRGLRGSSVSSRSVWKYAATRMSTQDRHDPRCGVCVLWEFSMMRARISRASRSSSGTGSAAALSAMGSDGLQESDYKGYDEPQASFPEEIPHGSDHVGDLGRGQLRVDRQAENPAGEPLGDRKRTGPVAERRGAFLEMDRDRVVDAATDAVSRQVLDQAIALVELDDEGVVDAFLVTAVARNPDHIREAFAVLRGDLAAPAVPSVEPLELDRGDPGLERVETRVVAPDVALVPVAQPVVAQHQDALIDLAVRGGDETSVAHHAEILDGVQAEAGADSEGADPASLVARADRLRRVLDHGDAFLARDRVHRVHFRRAAGQMHRDQRPGARRDRPFQKRRIDVVVLGDVDEYRLGSGCDDHPGGGDEGVRAGDHLVARSDPEGLENQEQRVGSACDPERVGHLAIRGCFGLESLDGLAENVLAARAYAVELRSQLV